MFSQPTSAAVLATAEYVAQDMEPRWLTPEVLAETAIDANRLSMLGYPKADAEVGTLIAAHGYPRVLEEAAKLVRTLL